MLNSVMSAGTKADKCFADECLMSSHAIANALVSGRLYQNVPPIALYKSRAFFIVLI